MVETNGQGSYKMAWFSGTSEGQDDVAIVVSHLTLNMTGGFEGAVWNAASVVSQRDGYSNQNAGRSNCSFSVTTLIEPDPDHEHTMNLDSLLSLFCF